jgi:isopenicillin-N N-acyltransferase like protein
MTPLAALPAEPLRLTGTPFERGLAQTVEGAQTCGEVRRVTNDRLAAADKAGLLGYGAERFLKAQRAFAEAECGPEFDELAGIAEAFDMPLDRLFAALHLGILRDLALAPGDFADGCSAWAVSTGPDGPLAVKNRDFSGAHAGIQRVFRHEGADLKHGPFLCLGSLGSPGAYSSGMNAAGLAVVDTQVGIRTHRRGWLRYFLMTRVLSQAATVAEALDLIGTARHAGGGTLVLADAGGAAAAIELGADAVSVEVAPLVCRTNHFTSTALAPETLTDPHSEIEDTSQSRRGFLDRTLPGRRWGMADAAGLMATHRGDDPQSAPLCQHPDAGGTRTISSVVYCCASRLMYVCLDNPCSGAWQRLGLDA